MQHIRPVNTCDTNPACYSDDTVATCTIFDADLGNPAYHKLTNVCWSPFRREQLDPLRLCREPADPKLTVTKIVNNNNGGTAVFSDFPLFVGSSSVVSGVQNTFPAGTYTVSETGHERLHGDYWGRLRVGWLHHTCGR